MGFIQEVFDIAVRAELYVNECFFGPLGFLNTPSNPLDCWRRRYYPYLPIWKLDGFPEWDMWIEYFEWTCNYEGGIANSRKREPTNVDDGTKPETKPSEEDSETFDNEPTNNNSGDGGLPPLEDDPLAEFNKDINKNIKKLPDHFIVHN